MMGYQAMGTQNFEKRSLIPSLSWRRFSSNLLRIGDYVVIFPLSWDAVTINYLNRVVFTAITNDHFASVFIMKQYVSLVGIHCSPFPSETKLKFAWMASPVKAAWLTLLC